MNFFVDLLVSLTRLLGGNLGLTLILIGVFSRVVFYPLLKSSYKHIEIQRNLKPKLDALKKKYPNDPQKRNQEQARIMMESGFNPLAGCLAPVVQLVVAILLFYALQKLIHSDVSTHFLTWDLAKPDTFNVSGIPFALPGVFIIVYAVATFIQSKMMMPQVVPVAKEDKKKEVEKKEDLAEALTASQGQFVYLMPLFILFTVSFLPAGLSLYLAVNTLTGVVLQYLISGFGGLESWVKILKK